jgi:hydroxyacylglutathione hydrolase
VILKHLIEDGISQSAYLIGCAETGEALVLDPTIDIGQYVEAASAEGLRITGVAETHIHADFVSGAPALAAATGAALYVSGEGGPDWQYGFAHEPHVRILRDGDVISVGNIRLRAVHTPGHTPEHLMFVVTDTRATDVPLGLLTGDFLFVGDVGRPDLLETAAGQAGTMDASARRLFASLRRLEPMADHLVVWPGHGSGSACGKSLSGVPVSSLGYERATNWGLRERDEPSFVGAVLADQPDPPMYFGEMKTLNRQGAPAWTPAPLAALTLDQVRARHAAGGLFIDVREDGAAAHLPGSLVIPAGRSFAAWAGSVVPAATAYVVVADTRTAAEAARRALAIIGRADVAGWIGPSTLDAFVAAGGRLDTVAAQDEPRPGQVLVDVRSTSEWRAGHLDGAVHVPLPRLPERFGVLDPREPVLVACQAGLRSVVAASALRRLGFARVASLAGGLSGYTERRRRPRVA